MRCGLLIAGLLVVTYQVENWRGQRAWKVCRELSAKRGLVLDLEKFVPPPIPNESNVFHAPMMMEWFGNRDPSDLEESLNPETVLCGLEREARLVAEIKVLPLNAMPSAEDVDLTLDYLGPFLWETSTDASAGRQAPRELLSVVAMNDVFLTDAISALAREANLNYMLDPQLCSKWLDSNNKPMGQPVVSFRYETLTALRALSRLLDSYNLEMAENPDGEFARIQPRNCKHRPVNVAPATRERLARILEKPLVAELNSAGVQKLRTEAGWVLFKDASSGPCDNHHDRPAQIDLRAETLPLASEVRQALSSLPSRFEPSKLRVAPFGTNAFRVYGLPTMACDASEYLVRTATFQREFDTLREALKRPLVRLDGNYASAFDWPQPNLQALRTVARTLAARAQAFLLLGESEEALREVQLIHNLCALTENKPLGLPTTLVAAMIRVAITRLYAQTISDGFGLGRWRESQVLALQTMLSEVSLAPAVVGALAMGRASVCRLLETASPAQFDTFYSVDGQSSRARFGSPGYWFIALAPRGWVYQNMVTMANLGQSSTPVYAAAAHRLNANLANNGLDSELKKLSALCPYSTLACMAIPNYVRAWQVTAEAQVLVTHGVIACALDGHRVARGSYPEKLNALVPRFAATLPRDILTGELPIYRLKDNGDYVLYSVGWNGVDDGGVTAAQLNSRDNVTSGDWVWQQPEGEN